MRFELDDEQAQLQASFRQLLAKECDGDRVRSAEPLGFDRALWTRLQDLGAASIAVPVEAGGSGGDLSDLIVVCEEVGRRVAPVPMVEAAVGARCLARLGAHQMLPKLADGIELATVALQPSVGGTIPLVAAGAVADYVVALAGADLLLLSRPTTIIAPRSTLGCTPVADWPIDDRAQVLLSGPKAQEAHAAACADWQVLTAASLVGLGLQALEMSVQYVTEREQFGVPLGSFQTVAHSLADVATALDGSSLLVHEAAWALDQESARGQQLGAMAYAFASETAQTCTRTGLRYHGGYGYMLEYDIQLYFRRAKASSIMLGDPASQFQRIGLDALTTIQED